MESSSMSNEEKLDYQKMEKKEIDKNYKGLYNYTNFDRGLINSVSSDLDSCILDLKLGGKDNIRGFINYIIDNVFEPKTIKHLVECFSRCSDLDTFKYLLDKFPSEKFCWGKILHIRKRKNLIMILNYIFDNGLEYRFNTSIPTSSVLNLGDKIPFDLFKKILYKDFQMSAKELIRFLIPYKSFMRVRGFSTCLHKHITLSKTMTLIYDKSSEIFYTENKHGETALSEWRNIWVKHMSNCIEAEK